jgi:hypothetical protein
MQIRLLFSSVIILVSSLIAVENHFFHRASTIEKEFYSSKQPTIKNSNLKPQLISSELKAPTSIAFLDRYDILVLERYNGILKGIINDTLKMNLCLTLIFQKA